MPCVVTWMALASVVFNVTGAVKVMVAVNVPLVVPTGRIVASETKIVCVIDAAGA